MSDDPPLLWSKRGTVACARHAPQPGDPQYDAERWRPVDEGFRYLQCQFCHGRPLTPDITRLGRRH